MGVTFTVVASEFDEYLDHNRPASDVASELAYGKALVVARTYPNAIVIGADTIPCSDGVQLEKPVSYDDALQILTSLSGRVHQVSTGFALVCLSDDLHYTTSDTTTVAFKPLDTAAIREYLATGDYKDKAGAYGIQSGAAPLIERISGYYDTVMGLPTVPLAAKLQELGCNGARPVELVWNG
jgi:septum formation protein